MTKALGRILIPVAQLELNASGNTLWIHNKDGATVLRIKSMRGFDLRKCADNVCSHADIVIDGPLSLCVAEDAVIE